jgi:hypothetical protein
MSSVTYVTKLLKNMRYQASIALSGSVSVLFFKKIAYIENIFS